MPLDPAAFDRAATIAGSNPLDGSLVGLVFAVLLGIGLVLTVKGRA